MRRIDRHLRRHGLLDSADPEPEHEGPPDHLIASAVSGQVPPAGPQGSRGLSPPRAAALGYAKPLCASLDGFTLHGGLAASSYLRAIWVMMGSVVGLGMYVFVQLDRDERLCRIGNSTAGEVTVDRALFARVLIWVVIPLLSVLAAQYPQIATALGQAVEPIARTLR